MPNTNPVLDNRTHIKYVIATAEREACVHVFPMGAVTAGQKGEKLTELGDMAECGAVAFSDDGRCVENAGLMRRALEYSKAVGRVIVQHCQDGPLTVDAMVNEGVVSTRLGLKGVPIIAEEIIAERDARLAKYCDARIHITHISTRGTVEIVRRAKRMGVELTCDVTPHHLLLTEEECLGFDTSFKMNPPLRTKKDVEVLEKALEDGTIDAVGSDHAPHTDYEKGLEFSTAPFGVIGLETTVPILLTHFVRAKKIGWPRFVELLSVNPARILGLRGKGSLAVGSDADVTVIDPELSFEYKPEEVVSKSRNSPFFGRRFVGRAVHTIVGGRVVMKDRVLRT
jgi:dihydroorotase